jgi:hypothetical protein
MEGRNGRTELEGVPGMKGRGGRNRRKGWKE